jgi:predicted dienelactone hydrolase
MREIGVEMKRFQRKYEESRELINAMRKNFLKELQHLKMKDSFAGVKQSDSSSRQPIGAVSLSSGGGAAKKLGGKYGSSLAHYQHA